MFPLNWNIPFIRKNGSRTTLGAITGDIAGIEEDITELTVETDGLWDNMIENGAVNYAPNKLTSDSDTNYSYSVDSDGVITVVVTNTLSTSATININSALSLKKGTYKLSGCADNGSVNTYRLQLYESSTPVALDYGKNGTPYPGDKGDTFTLSSNTTGLVLALRLGSGLTSGTYKFYPMITLPSYNGTYVPYAMTNRELTEREIITKKITGNSAVTVTGGNSVAYTDFTLPTGYELVGIVGYNVVSPIVPINIGNQGDNDIVLRLDLYNLLETDKTFTPQINVLLRKTI